MQDKVAKLCGSKAELIGEATQTDIALVTKQFRGKGVKVNLQLDMLYAHMICHILIIHPIPKTVQENFFLS